MIEPGGRVRRCVALFRFLHDEWPHPSLVPKSPPTIRQKNHSGLTPRQAADSSPHPGQGFESYRQCLNLEENSREPGQTRAQWTDEARSGKAVTGQVRLFRDEP